MGLQHPALVRCYGTVQGLPDTDGSALIHEPFRQTCHSLFLERPGSVPPHGVRRIAQQVCSALVYLQRHAVPYPLLSPAHLWYDPATARVALYGAGWVPEGEGPDAADRRQYAAPELRGADAGAPPVAWGAAQVSGARASAVSEWRGRTARRFADPWPLRACLPHAQATAASVLGTGPGFMNAVSRVQRRGCVCPNTEPLG